ncbi:MAG: YegP family protein [Neptuniibacter sp.]
MSAKFEMYRDVQQQYRFRLKAGNGEIILASEAYVQKAGCENGIQSVKAHAPYDANYQKLTAQNGKYYFNLLANNYQVIGTSQMYQSTAGRDVGIQSVKTNAPNAPVLDLT